MLPRRIASRYAEALFDLAQQQGKTSEWEQELASLATVIADTPDLVAVLTHPEIPLKKKEAVVTKAFQGKVSSEPLAVLFMLLKRGHDPDFQTIHAIYQEIWNQQRRILPVTVASAVPLNPRQADDLARVLAQRTGMTIHLSQQLDPELIAGLVITAGDRVIDASARTTLDELRTAMAGI